MPWNASNNPAGDIRAPAIATALRLQQQRNRPTDSVTPRAFSLRVVEMDDLNISHEYLKELRHCALLHPKDFPTDAAGPDGTILVHPRLHAQFVVAARSHEAVPCGHIALSQVQMINLELCSLQTEKWALFWDQVSIANAVAIEIRPMLMKNNMNINKEEEEVTAEAIKDPTATIVTDAKEFAAAFIKYTWQRVLTEHERIVMAFKDGHTYFVRVLEVDVKDEDETDFTMPDSYRGRVDHDTQIFVSSDNGDSSAFKLLNTSTLDNAGLKSVRSDVVTVLTNDGEEFPVKKKLLFPCIKLSSAVLSGMGVHKDATTTIKVDVDCCTFDRVLLYLEHEARDDSTEFQFDPSVIDDLLAAAIKVGCVGLQEVCQKRFGEFESRVRKEAIRWVEVVRRNASGEVWLVMQGMVLDITRWVPEHPGGSELIAQEAINVDSTVMFEIYHASRQSFRYLKQFYIGELSEFDIGTIPATKEQPSEAFIQELQHYTTWRIKPKEHVYKSF
ncbi:cytochrome b5 [Plasmopara halstedii]|uniref:Cytochrome b5 n=1 Tax=Plasmopara halstedii TaxID=4781 RepID=A0A0P1AM33_PLAHL|nr:cytochrome b5 [Plasmopara halstedii]CEG42481.1 cytochrome b5 [Plasmopara halstedii]|eukprot:XP_024578850.1 cytochrome b5 [Plasmopara halstedii]